MEIKNNGYNMAEITISEALTSGTPVKLGTRSDLDKIMNIAKAGGVGRINATVGGNAMSGACFLNAFEGDGNVGVDVGSVTNFGESPNAVTGTFYMSGNDLYGVVTITPLGSQAKSTKK